MLNHFWSNFFSLLHKLFGIRLSIDPWLALLHFKPSGVTKGLFELTNFILLAFKMSIARKWKRQFTHFSEVKS